MSLAFFVIAIFDEVNSRWFEVAFAKIQNCRSSKSLDWHSIPIDSAATHAVFGESWKSTQKMQKTALEVACPTPIKNSI